MFKMLKIIVLKTIAKQPFHNILFFRACHWFSHLNTFSLLFIRSTIKQSPKKTLNSLFNIKTSKFKAHDRISQNNL